MRKKTSDSLGVLLKIGLLGVAVLAALALTSPNPPLSDAASQQGLADSTAARQQLEQLKLEMAEQHVRSTLPDEGAALAVEPSVAEAEPAPQRLTPEQETELERIRNRLVLSNEPLNLVEPPKDDTLDDSTQAALLDLDVQARQQARQVEPYINQELEDKKLELAAEEARLRLERQSMEQLKEAVEQRLAELKEVQKAVEEITNMEDKSDQARQATEMSLEEREVKVLQVSKMISQMKPRPAAGVLELLRSDLAVEVMRKITPRVAGKIMAVMEKEKAAVISTLMARQDKVVQAQFNEAQAGKEVDSAWKAAGQTMQQAANADQKQNKPPSQQ